MIPAPPLPTAEEQHALASLLTRRLALMTAGLLVIISATLLVITAHKAMGRTATRMDPIVAPAR